MQIRRHFKTIYRHKISHVLMVSVFVWLGFVSVAFAQEQASPATSNQCNYLQPSYLRMGRANDAGEVKKLQQFLRDHEGASAVVVSGIFDQATFNAVSAFQVKYASEILAPWGYTAPTGIAYILTENKINELVCGKQIPLTVKQEQEIYVYRTAFLAGVSPFGSVTVIMDQPKTQPVVVPSQPVDIIKSFEEDQSEKMANEQIFDAVDSFTKNEKVGGFAASVFALPRGNDAFEAVVLFIVSLLVLNVISTYIGRRALVFLVGSGLAAIAVYLFDKEYLVLPFVFVFIVSSVVFVMKMFRGGADDSSASNLMAERKAIEEETAKIAQQMSVQTPAPTPPPASTPTPVPQSLILPMQATAPMLEEMLEDVHDHTVEEVLASAHIVQDHVQESVPTPEPIPASMLDRTTINNNQ